jgi:hypothetical protein
MIAKHKHEAIITNAKAFPIFDLPSLITIPLFIASPIGTTYIGALAHPV